MSDRRLAGEDRGSFEKELRDKTWFAKTIHRVTWNRRWRRKASYCQFAVGFEADNRYRDLARGDYCCWSRYRFLLLQRWRLSLECQQRSRSDVCRQRDLRFMPSGGGKAVAWVASPAGNGPCDRKIGAWRFQQCQL